MRHNIANRLMAFSTGKKQYVIDDYTSGYYALWDATEYGYPTPSQWLSHGTQNKSMSLNSTTGVQNAGKDFVETGSTNLGSRYTFAALPTEVNELFRGNEITIEVCYTISNLNQNAIAQDWVTASFAEDETTHRGYCIKYESDDTLGLYLDRSNADRNTPNIKIAGYSDLNKMYTVTMARKGNDVKCYVNGECVGQFSVDGRMGSCYLYIGSHTTENVKHHCHRYYPKELTASEIAKNHKIDKSRFEEGHEEADNLFRFPSDVWYFNVTPTDEIRVRFDKTYPSIATNGYSMAQAYTTFNITDNSVERQHASNALTSYHQMVFLRIYNNKTYRLTFDRDLQAANSYVRVVYIPYSSTDKVLFSGHIQTLIANTSASSLTFNTTGRDSNTGVFAVMFMNTAKDILSKFSNIKLVEVRL